MSMEARRRQEELLADIDKLEKAKTVATKHNNAQLQREISEQIVVLSTKYVQIERAQRSVF